MDILHIIILSMSILLTNMDNVIAEELKDLDKLFYPIALSRVNKNYVRQKIKSSLEQNNTRHVKSEGNPTSKHAVNFMTKFQDKRLRKQNDKKKVKYQGDPTPKQVGNFTARYQNESFRNREIRYVANYIGKRVKLLCWVLTHPANHIKLAIHITETWGKRCDKLLFMSSEKDYRVPTVKLPVEEGKNLLWGKVKAAFQYIYKHHLHEADWFLKADDDTYVVVENLKYMLKDYKSSDLIYFGSRYKSEHTKDGYFSGGAGYVLSRAAVSLFVEQGILNTMFCNDATEGAEDLELTICLDQLGVTPMDSRDKYNRGRFFPFSPQAHIHPKHIQKYWYWDMIYYPVSKGRDCCSEYTITFHYMHRNTMYLLDYFVYHLRPYGISYEYGQINN